MFLFVQKNIIKNIKLLENYKKIIIEEFIPEEKFKQQLLGQKNLEQLNLNQKENFMIMKQNIILKLKQNILFQ